MRKAIKLAVLVMGLLMSLWTCAEAGVLGIAKSILRGGNPVLWFWAGVQGLMKLLEAHPTATKAILGTSLAAQLLGIIQGKTSGFPWTLFLLAVTLLAAVALVVMLRRK
jgi:hypothetical protein